MKTRLKRKTYGIDLDGVSFDFVQGFLDHLNMVLGMNLTKEDVKSYYWYETADDISKERFFEEFHRFGRAKGYRNLAVIPGTLEALRAIVADGHNVYFITNRPAYALQDTIEALEEHNFPCRENLIFAKGDKSPVIKEKGVDVFIDDSPKTLSQITANTRATIYCRSYEYNNHLDETFLTRVNSWAEFLEHAGITIKM